jgi:hypothetical protein
MDFWQGLEPHEIEGLTKSFQPQIEVLKKGSLSPEKVQQLLLFSFRFSQGSEDLQDTIFEYLHEKFPKYKVNPDDYNLIMSELSSKIKKLFDPKGIRHSLGNEPSIVPQTRTQFLKLEEVLNSDEFPSYPEDDNVILTEMFSLMLDKDILYTVHKEGGRPSGVVNAKQPQQDKFSSHFVDYGMRRVKTGMSEYDQMFEDLIKMTKKYIKNHPDWETSESSPLFGLRKLIDIYNKNHPTQTVDINDLIKES